MSTTYLLSLLSQHSLSAEEDTILLLVSLLVLFNKKWQVENTNS